MAGACSREIAGVEEEIGEMSFSDFVQKMLVVQPPKQPFSYRLEFLNDLTPGKLRVHLIFLAVQVSQAQFGKKLSELNYSEIDKVQKYLHSIGFQIRYEPDPKSENILNGIDRDQLTIRDFLLFFEPASLSLRN